MTLIAVCPEPGSGVEAARQARELAAELHLPLVEQPQAAGDDVVMLLIAEAERLSLRVVGGDDVQLRGGRAIAVDLLQVDTRSPAGRRTRQPIARAVGLGRRQAGKRTAPMVIDATAGFGEDAWLLASLGCRVMAVERSPIVAALLRDGLRRAADVYPQIAERLELRVGDGRTVVQTVSDADVIYLDPMFPVGRKTVERKAMRVLRLLVGADEDAVALFRAARASDARRVVVKRPLRAAALDGQPPTVTHQGRAMRYDVYVK
jgi:16S rRNA (guanine1516-N2)-methyltransferase